MTCSWDESSQRAEVKRNRTVKGKGVAVLLIEQKLTIAMRISDRALVMGHGSIVFDGTPSALVNAPAVRQEWLEI